MLRVARPEFFKRSALAIRTFASTTDGEDSQHSDIRNVSQPALRQKGAKNKDLSDILDGIKPKGQVNALTNQDEIMEIAGVPEEHQYERRARIYKPARNSEQSGWNNTKRWKIELDNQGRWENPLIGYSSNADPLSNISMQLDFPSEQDAIAFCEKNKWPYTLEPEQVRQIKPKAYGSNFHWSKRTRVGTK